MKCNHCNEIANRWRLIWENTNDNKIEQTNWVLLDKEEVYASGYIDPVENEGDIYLCQSCLDNNRLPIFIEIQ